MAGSHRGRFNDRVRASAIAVPDGNRPTARVAEGARRVCGVALLFLLLIEVAGCSVLPARPPIRLQVAPSEVRDAAAGETCILLTTAASTCGSRWDMHTTTVSVECVGGRVESQPESLVAGKVGEIHIVPEQAAIGGIVSVSVSGDAHTSPTSVDLKVTEPLADRVAFTDRAMTVRDAFIPWLATAHPDLGITEVTEWTCIPIRTHLLVVTHCLFLSESWEMAVWWHVTAPPNDWARIALRHRGTEALASRAFEISSLLEATAPTPIHPPQELIR